jgi:hypothetical protein
VLYNSYYVPHIAISLAIFGLTFAKTEGKSTLRIACRVGGLILLSFLGGLGGIRQGMMTHAPLLLAVVFYFIMDDMVCKTKNPAKMHRRVEYLLNAIASGVAFFVGYLINTNILSKMYEFSDYSGNMVGLLDVSYLKNVAYGLMHHFGFRDQVKLMSVLGVLAVFGVILTIACVVTAISQVPILSIL